MSKLLKESQNNTKTQISSRTPDFWEGFNFACDLLEDLGYTKLSTHHYNIADCLKAKMNRLPKSKIRKNEKETVYSAKDIKYKQINS